MVETSTWQLIALFGSMLSVGITGVLPPSTPIYLGAGVAIAAGALDPVATMLCTIGGHTLGVMIQYGLSSRAQDYFVDCIPDAFRGLFETVTQEVRTCRFTTLALYRVLDPIKIFIGLAAGIAGVPWTRMLPAMILGTTCYGLILLSIGASVSLNDWSTWISSGLMLAGMSLCTRLFLRSRRQTPEINEVVSTSSFTVE